MNSKKQIVFMHIAKAAGSSINNIFAQVLGEENCHFHIESSLLKQSYDEVLENKIFISGHAYFNIIEKISTENTIKFTILREPYSHIISHILWLDHYGMPEYENEYESLNKDVKSLVDLIAKTDISNAYELDELLTNLPPWGIKLLNNCQTRYLLGQQNNFQPLSLKSFSIAMKHLKLFDVYGSMDNIKEVITSVFQLYGEQELKIENCDFEKKTNQKISNRMIDIKNSLICSVLQKHILVDLRVYNYMISQQNRAITTL